MQFSIQTEIKHPKVCLRPLLESDFDALYAVASDPKIWEQHPNPNRWQEAIFRVFFEGAMQSKGAFLIVDEVSQMPIGSTRFYDFNAEENSILIGYTFYATAYWGKGINTLVKEQMLNYVFQFVDSVYFYVGALNVRSQIAIQRIGAQKVAEKEVVYFGEAEKLNYIYKIEKANWELKRPQ